MRHPQNIPDIVSRFAFEGRFVRAEPIRSGHIHDTFAVYYRNSGAGEHRYLLQRINHYVFRRPEELMVNIAAVTGHLRRKVAASGGDPERESLTLIPTLDNGFLHLAGGGYYYRAYVFIEDAQTYQIPENGEHIYSAARSFGNFQRLLNDFPVGDLYEMIPDFHHTAKRFDHFVRAVEADVNDRALGVSREIDFVLERAGETSQVIDLISKGDLPVRVTHNDTKFNNVLIDDQTGEGICVIDLDTVMPGSSLYDFGDAIRSITNTAAEDEPDLSKVQFNLDAFQHYTRGYLDATGDTLTPVEIEQLPFSACLMTLECGMRFLTDYLDGDVYFKTQRQNQNLDRCRTQFKLVQGMEEKFVEMSKIVERAK